MRSLHLLLCTVLFFSCVNRSPEQSITVDLSDYWKFKTGDSVQWADPSYNDSSWDSIKAPYCWESQGLPHYDGFAWYRKRILLPSGMKEQAYHDTIVFDLGKIDDCSQIYMNGKLIESSPNFDSGCSKDCGIYHMLFFTTGQLEWDKEIVIAVRVHDAGGSGGFSNPDMRIYPLMKKVTQEPQAIRINDVSVKSGALVLNTPATILFKIDNLTAGREQATLKYYLINSYTDSIKMRSTPLTLEPGEHEYPITFNPVMAGFYYFTYALSFENQNIACIQGRHYAGYALGKVPAAPFNPKKTPLIYSADVFHPYGDPDDHLDLAAIFSLEEIEIRSVILDQGLLQKNDNGILPVTQMKYISGHNVPANMGLPFKLKSPDDKALDQPEEFQCGVEQILQTLAESPVPVLFAAVGSLRDFAAAFNRDPELFRKKAGKLFLLIGDAHAPDNIPYECNVMYDSCAFIRLMNSGLQIYWIPCFDGGYRGDTNASVWPVTHDRLLKYASPLLINYISYMLSRKSDPDFISYLTTNTNQKEIDIAMGSYRWVYGVGNFHIFTGMEILKKGNDYRAVSAASITKDDTIVHPFTFISTSVFVDQKAVIHFEKSARSHEVMLFTIQDKELYPDIMTSVTAHLYGNLK